MQVPQYPQNVIFTITDKCNQVCRFCAGTHRKTAQAEADPDALRLPWLAHASSIMIVGAGEALAHPQYPAIIKNIYKSAPSVPITLYTNGLGLHGKNLEYTLRHASHIKISQNTLSEKVYNTIIAGGNYRQSIKNLQELSKQLNKYRNISVTLMLVALKQNIHELKNFIDCASNLGFQCVHVMKGFYPNHDGLRRDSYIDAMDDEIDISNLKHYAQKHGVTFTTNLEFRSALEEGPCLSPWKECRLRITPKGWRCDVYCRGTCGIYMSDAALQDIQKFWLHNRLNFIRRTVNTDEILANKMCLKCRLCIRDEKFFYDNEDMIHTKLKIKNAFDEIYIEEERERVPHTFKQYD